MIWTREKNVHPVLNENYTLYLTPEGYILGYALADQSPDQYLYVEDSDEELATGSLRWSWRTAPPPRWS